MYAAIATLGLSFLLTFFSVGVSEAEVWICSQPGGGTLFTDVPQTDGSCEKHEPVSQLNYAPPINWANVPPAEATYERQAAIQLDPQAVSRADEQYATPSEAADFGYYGDNENSVFTEVYTYVPGFYGIPSLRRIQPRNFLDKPRQAQELRHMGHLLPHVGSQMPFTHSEHSVRTVAPGLPTHSAPPALSRHARESSVAVASGAQQPQSASTMTPNHVQGNSVGRVTGAQPQSSSQTSSMHLHESSGQAGVHEAPSQSLGFRQDTKH